MWDAIIITPFINVLLFIYNLVGQNFGIAIILFTILIRLITHPLMVQQIKGTQGMQDLQKNEKWMEIQEKYKGDKEKLAQEQMASLQRAGDQPICFLPADADPVPDHYWPVPGDYPVHGQYPAGSAQPGPPCLSRAFWMPRDADPVEQPVLVDEPGPAGARDIHFWHWYPGAGDPGGDHHLPAVEADDPAFRQSKRSDGADDGHDEPVYAHLHGLAGLDAGFGAFAVLCGFERFWYFAVRSSGKGKLEVAAAW